MPAPLHLWIRHETRPHEQRAPVTPDDVARLVQTGVQVSVEESPVRVFAEADYAAAGATIVSAGGWVDAPEQSVILGLKELPEAPAELRHRHIFFGHAYKGQPGAVPLLRRFAAGGGVLLDLEYLVDERDRRVAAFGYWAGYIGAALAALQARGHLPVPLRPTSQDALDQLLRSSLGSGGRETALVTGAAGRSGSGAVDALAVAGIQATGWDRSQTAHLDRPALLAHEILVHCVLATTPSPAFLRTEDLSARGRQLRVLGDVTCDLGSELNLVPVNDEATSWDEPVRVVEAAGHADLDAADATVEDVPPPLEVIAIDNLPSLLPREASRGFSTDLLPHLLALHTQTDPPVWRRAEQLFQDHMADAARTETGHTDVTEGAR